MDNAPVQHTQGEATEAVTDYLHLRGPDIANLHDALMIGETFSGPKGKPGYEERWGEFEDVLRSYRKREIERLHFDPSACTWSDVFRELEQAQDAADRADPTRNPSARRERTVVNMSRMIEPALQAFPDELGILRGSLGVLFNIAQRRVETRQAILNVFEDIPEIIAMAYSKLKTLPNDAKLRESIEGLKQTLFDAIPELVDILLPDTIKKKLTGPFKGFRAQELLSFVAVSVKRVESRARLLSDEIVLDKMDDISMTTTEIHSTTLETVSRVESLHQGVRDLTGQYDGIDSRILELARCQSTMQQLLQNALGSQSGMLQMLQDVFSAIIFEQESDQRNNAGRPQHRPSRSLEKLRAIFRMLRVDGMHDSHDLSAVLRQSHEFDQASKSYGAAILSNERFRRWITARGPDMIYVEARLDPSAFGKTSPISYFSANFVKLLEDKAAVLTLHFFCGQHSASNDKLCGPRGLIRSLQAQLVQKWPQDAPTDGINITEELDYSHETFQTERFCKLFETMLAHIPSHFTIICVIDDIPRLERGHWANDFWVLMTMLGNLVYQSNPGLARLKLLMTSPTRSRLLQDQIPEQALIELTEKGMFMGDRAQQAVWRSAKSGL